MARISARNAEVKAKEDKATTKKQVANTAAASKPKRAGATSTIEIVVPTTRRPRPKDTEGKNVAKNSGKAGKGIVGRPRKVQIPVAQAGKKPAGIVKSKPTKPVVATGASTKATRGANKKEDVEKEAATKQKKHEEDRSRLKQLTAKDVRKWALSQLRKVPDEASETEKTHHKQMIKDLLERDKVVAKGSADLDTNEVPTEGDSTEYELERVISVRIYKSKPEYFVLWKGYAVGESTWEPAKHLKDALDYVEEYYDAFPSAAGAKKFRKQWGKEEPASEENEDDDTGAGAQTNNKAVLDEVAEASVEGSTASSGTFGSPNKERQASPKKERQASPKKGGTAVKD